MASEKDKVIFLMSEVIKRAYAEIDRIERVLPDPQLDARRLLHDTLEWRHEQLSMLREAQDRLIRL